MSTTREAPPLTCQCCGRIRGPGSDDTIHVRTVNRYSRAHYGECGLGSPELAAAVSEAWRAALDGAGAVLVAEAPVAWADDDDGERCLRYRICYRIPGRDPDAEMPFRPPQVGDFWGPCAQHG